jgi:hypothetical protein
MILLWSCIEVGPSDSTRAPTPPTTSHQSSCNNDHLFRHRINTSTTWFDTIQFTLKEELKTELEEMASKLERLCDTATITTMARHLKTTNSPTNWQPTQDEYHYQPLDRSVRGLIRLLRIEPSTLGIRCTLQNVTMLPSTRYKAVSYTWGPASPTRQILINNSPFTIRENLYHFLKIWQEEGSEDLLWIDQICIDQSNNLERNHQVNYMGQIYSNALQVMVWLGPAADNSDVALRIIQNPRWDPSKLKEQEKCEIRALFSRSYWKRVWVIQEVMLARSLLLFCGMKKVAWSNAERMVYLDDEDGITRQQGMRFAKTIFMERSTFRRDYLKSLHQLVSAFLEWECEDPRDKVFGLLGMTFRESHNIPLLDSIPYQADLQTPYVEPRYDLPAEQICEVAIRECVRTSQISRRSHLEAALRLGEALMVPHLDFDRIVDQEFGPRISNAPWFAVNIRN